MTDHRHTSAGLEPSLETIRAFLAGTAQREIDALRAELDVRLGALEAALGRGAPRPSLERLVLELARVATAEAESAAARAALEAQLHAQERSAAAVSAAQRALEAEHAITTTLQLELERVQTELEAERDAAARLRREVAGIHKGSDADGVLRRQVAELQQALQNERARSDTLDRELATERDAATRISNREATLQSELDAAQRAAQTRSVQNLRELEQARAVLRAATDAEGALRRHADELEQALQKERTRRDTLDRELATERDATTRISSRVAALQSELDAAQRAARTRTAADDDHRAQVESVEQKYAELDRRYADSVGRLEETVRDRDALAAALEAERQTTVATVAANEKRLAAAGKTAAGLDAERQKMVATVAANEKRLAAAEKTAAGLDAEHQKMTAALAAAEKRLATAEKTAAGVEAERQKMAAALATAEKRLATAEKITAGLDAERQQMAATLAAAEKRLATAEKTTTGIDTERQKMAAALAAAEKTAAVLASEEARARQQRAEIEDRARKAGDERDALAAALAIDRDKHAAELLAVEQRAAASEAARLIADEAREEAEARAEAEANERDDLEALLEAAKKSVQGMHAAVEERLAVIDAKRARTIKALEESEARADAAIRERDTLASELAAIRAAPADDPHMTKRLEAANERIRSLELQVFERDRGSDEADVDLAPLLDTPPPVPYGQAAQRATRRHGFRPTTKVQIDKQPGVLVDLSVTGAQIISTTLPDVGQIVTLRLQSDQVPCSCEGRLLWARREQTAKGRPFKYRAGIVFTAADESAINAFIDRHAVN
jgi:hypothetical protein